MHYVNTAFNFFGELSFRKGNLIEASYFFVE